MANRSYLYSMNKSWVKKSDISEFNQEVPLLYKILIGVETELTKSWIWKDYEYPIAFIANFRKGLKRYINLLEYLAIITEEHQEKFESYIKITNDFFEKNPEKKSVLFFMEPGETFELISDLESPKDQAVNLFEEIQCISKDVDSFLGLKKKELLKGEFDNSLINKLLESPEVLEPVWQEVCYYSFNHTRSGSYKNKNNNHLYAKKKSEINSKLPEMPSGKQSSAS